MAYVSLTPLTDVGVLGNGGSKEGLHTLKASGNEIPLGYVRDFRV